VAAVTSPRLPLSLRITLLACANALVSLLLGIAAPHVAASLRMPPALTVVAAIALSLLFAIWSTHGAMRRVTRTLQAVTNGVRGLRENDLSLRLAARGNDEAADLVGVYNEVAEVLRRQRSDLYQRELLLDTILQGSPMAVVLTNPADRVVFSNLAARELLANGRRFDGRRFADVVAELPEELREVIRAGEESLFTIRSDERDETFHFVRRRFYLNTQQHTLTMLERLTPELRRQELGVWKRVIRTINHELNNSIAPISSLFHTARTAQRRPEHAYRLDEIYDTIEERLAFLRDFLDSYAQFARLPAPRPESASWRVLLDDVGALYPFRRDGTPPDAPGWFDPAQMQQVLINLVKNAHESGSAPEEIVVTLAPTAGGGTLLRVLDRGQGMDDAALRQALLPFHTTKPGGTGIGLALSNEIIEAHGGRLTLQRREGGGVAVGVWVPERQS
jgi:nitrogen fixation/metabolism regulation signal transduction histidine kinase